MKIKSALIILSLVICVLLTGCGDETATTTSTEEVPTNSTGSDVVETGELVAPEMEWWELYNPNGYDTFTAVITNTNSVAIDVTYDVVFYKDGAEVSRIEDCFNDGIMAGHEDLIWINWDVPASTDVDEVKLENVIVDEAYNTPIDGSYEYIGIKDGDACFEFSFDSKPTLATIWFLLYNDENGNKAFDKGEIVVVNTASLMEQKGEASFDTNVYDYTDYEVFVKAY